MGKRYLAYITPIKPPVDDMVLSNITFITGDLDHKTITQLVSKDYFTFYYYGSTLEVIETDNNHNITNIHDMTKDDAMDFGVSLKTVVTLNNKTFDMLVSNDFTYNLKQNKFYNCYPQTVENIYRTIQTVSNFILRVYIRNGAIIYIELDTDIKPNSDKSKYALSPGFVTADKNKLRSSDRPTYIPENKKLTQKDIDELLITTLVE